MKRGIIVGSGITGMAAALLLAKQNSFDEIIILEAAKSPAPLLSGFSRQGLHFDTGFHCAGGLRENGILRYWLKSLGVWDHIGSENLYPISEEFRFANSKKNYFFPSAQHELLPSIATQFSKEHADTFAKFIDKIQSILDISAYTNIHCHTLPKLSFEHSQSFLSELNSLDLPDTLKQMLKARCLLYGLYPEQATFHDYALVGGLYFDSCHGIYGGGKTLVKAFIKAMQPYNIKIRCKAKVHKIIHQDKKLQHIQLHDGEILSANTCIFTGHPAQLPKLIDKGIFRSAFYEHIASLEETISAFILFAENDNNYIANRAVYLLPNETGQDIVTPLCQENPTAYIVGSHKKGLNKNYPFMVIIPLKNQIFSHISKPRPKEYTTWKQTQIEFISQYIKWRLPELGNIKIHDSATHASLKDWIYGSSGSLYGITHTTSSIPLLPVTRMQGLILAGQNILLPGILGGIVSAALAVGFATDHASVLHNFRTTCL